MVRAMVESTPFSVRAIENPTDLIRDTTYSACLMALQDEFMKDPVVQATGLAEFYLGLCGVMGARQGDTDFGGHGLFALKDGEDWRFFILLENGQASSLGIPDEEFIPQLDREWKSFRSRTRDAIRSVVQVGRSIPEEAMRFAIPSYDPAFEEVC